MNLTRRSALRASAAAAVPLLAACAPQHTPSAAPTDGQSPGIPKSGPASAAPTSSRTVTKLTVGLTYIPNVQFAAFYVAKGNGLFAGEGLDVSLRHHGAQEDLFGALLANTEQLVCASSDEAMVAHTSEHKLVTTGTLFQRYPVCLVAPKAAGITSLADLAGKRIGIPGHFGSSYYAMLAGLKRAGMTEGDVSLQDIGYTQFTALRAGRVDAVVGYLNNEPVVANAQWFEVDVLDLVDPAAPSLVGPGIITLADRLDRDVLGRVNRALVAAEKLIEADLSVGVEAAARFVPAINTDAARSDATAVLAATSHLWFGTDGAISAAVNTHAFEAMRDLLVGQGFWKNPAPVSDTYVVVG